MAESPLGIIDRDVIVNWRIGRRLSLGLRIQDWDIALLIRSEAGSVVSRDVSLTVSDVCISFSGLLMEASCGTSATAGGFRSNSQPSIAPFAIASIANPTILVRRRIEPLLLTSIPDFIRLTG